eukprot:3374077-Rhodomonas_salina.1
MNEADSATDSSSLPTSSRLSTSSQILTSGSSNWSLRARRWVWSWPVLQACDRKQWNLQWLGNSRTGSCLVETTQIVGAEMV